MDKSTYKKNIITNNDILPNITNDITNDTEVSQTPTQGFINAIVDKVKIAMDEKPKPDELKPEAAPAPEAAAPAEIDTEILRTQKQEQINRLEDELTTLTNDDEKNKKKAEIDALKVELAEMKGGRRRSTRRRQKKSSKKSRRKSKKGGKKHRKSTSKKSGKSKKRSHRKKH